MCQQVPSRALLESAKDPKLCLECLEAALDLSDNVNPASMSTMVD